jgi:hypothetical protein
MSSKRFGYSQQTVYNNATGITKAAYTNLHNWYGGVASLNTKIAEGITLDVGVDLRTYKGSHPSFK